LVKRGSPANAPSLERRPDTRWHQYWTGKVMPRFERTRVSIAQSDWPKSFAATWKCNWRAVERSVRIAGTSLQRFVPVLCIVQFPESYIGGLHIPMNQKAPCISHKISSHQAKVEVIFIVRKCRTEEPDQPWDYL
jgi:hypothetical protein